MHRIPLFPLNTVLFPGMWLPLQIFEPRYKTMLDDCGMVEGQFGVTLIREGAEVGGAADPHLVGTVARIAKAVPLPDGRIFIETQGMRRFRISELFHDRPYLRGDVDFIDHARPPRARVQAALEPVVKGYQAYVETVRTLGGQISEAPHTQHDAEFFSWLVASTLPVPPALRQELLETDDLVERLEREAELLEETVNVLRSRAERKAGARPPNLPFSLN